MISAIVCARNEEKTIKTVLDAIMACEEVGEVIVVSDGSTDQTAAIVRTYPVHLIEHAKSWGKAQSMEDAVHKVRGETLLFLDADLYRITGSHIKKLISVYKKEKGMVVGLRDRGKLLNALAHIFPLISGQRIMEKEIFEKTPSKRKQGYQIEVALNATTRHLHKKITSVRLRGVTVRTKINKSSVPKALYQYGDMAVQVMQSLILTPINLWLTTHSKTKK